MESDCGDEGFVVGQPALEINTQVGEIKMVEALFVVVVMAKGDSSGPGNSMGHERTSCQVRMGVGGMTSREDW